MEELEQLKAEHAKALEEIKAEYAADWYKKCTHERIATINGKHPRCVFCGRFARFTDYKLPKDFAHFASIQSRIYPTSSLRDTL